MPVRSRSVDLPPLAFLRRVTVPRSIALLIALTLLAVGGCGRRASPAVVNAPKVYSEKNVWTASGSARNQAQRTCFSVEVTPACFEQQMTSLGATAEAASFYHDTDVVLVGFLSTGGAIDVGAGELPFRNVAGELLLLNGRPSIQTLNDLLGAIPERILTSSSTYAELADALSAGPERNNPQPSALVFWAGDERLESASKSSAKGQELVFQLGLHDLCRACGVGVAARIAFDFGPDGKLQGTKLLGYCEGSLVTREILGKPTTFHDFAGLSAGETITEPYLITLPDLKTCPVETRVFP